MDRWFVILFGVLVSLLYVPPIIAPARHRELFRSLLTKTILRRLSIVPVTVGVVAILLSNNSDLHHRMLFILGVIEILAGVCLFALPAIIISKFQLLFSRSLNIWIARGVLKFALGLAIMSWGINYF